MTHTWKLVRLVAVLAALFAAANLFAGDPEKPLTDAEKLDKILKQLTDLTKKTDDIAKKAEDARYMADTKFASVDDQLRLLTERIAKLEEAARKASTIVRESRFEPTPLPAKPLGFGAIVLQSTWGGPATVTVNDMRYVVPPYETITLPNLPVGNYTYDVQVNGYGLVRGPITRYLDNNTRMVISVYPIPTAR
jgi:hypothetical protein